MLANGFLKIIVTTRIRRLCDFPFKYVCEVYNLFSLKLRRCKNIKMKIITNKYWKIFFFKLAIFASSANADERFSYEKIGSFYFFDGMPKAIFFFDKIERGDSFAFREAIRRYSIDIVVLSSPGGVVSEGLQLSGIIDDRNISTIVPNGANCASSCSFMFFAGANRIAMDQGKLGVHQFTSNNLSATSRVETEASSQYAVSEIISFLNFYDTPPFVYEAMFRTPPSDMYFFTVEEKKFLNKGDSNFAHRANMVSLFLNDLSVYLDSMKKSKKVRKLDWPHRSKFIPEKYNWNKSKDYSNGLYCYDPDRKIVFHHGPFSMTTCGGKSYPISKGDYLTIVGK